MKTKKLRNSIFTLAALLCSGNYAIAGIVVDITFANPTATVFTATISGSATLVASPALNEWADVEFQNFEWRNMSRDSGVNIIANSAFNYYPSVPVSNSTAIASTASDSIAITAVDLFSWNNNNRNDFGFHFNRNPSFAPGQTVNFSGSFDFSLGALTAAEFSSGTWSSAFGIWWVSDLIPEDQGLTLNISPVPEPSTCVMAGFGLTCAALGAWHRRRSVATA